VNYCYYYYYYYSAKKKCSHHQQHHHHTTTTTTSPSLSSSSTTTTTKDKNGNLEKMNTSEFNATQGSFYFYFLGGHWDLGNCPRNLGGPFPCFGGERETQREREREGGEANVGLFV
jgi:hypothetical protein